MATEMKQYAKREANSSYAIDRRKHLPEPRREDVEVVDAVPAVHLHLLVEDEHRSGDGRVTLFEAYSHAYARTVAGSTRCSLISASSERRYWTTWRGESLRCWTGSL